MTIKVNISKAVIFIGSMSKPKALKCYFCTSILMVPCERGILTDDIRRCLCTSYACTCTHAYAIILPSLSQDLLSRGLNSINY